MKIMENKYYTPEIEEFYVGFEYEIKQLDLWIKESMQSNECLCDYINTNGYRVKYLDREDIESLGWKLYSKSENYIIFNYNENHLTLHNTIPNIGISMRDKRTMWSLGRISINIKNKSELRVLMKQLNIE